MKGKDQLFSGPKSYQILSFHVLPSLNITFDTFIFITFIVLALSHEQLLHSHLNLQNYLRKKNLNVVSIPINYQVKDMEIYNIRLMAI